MKKVSVKWPFIVAVSSLGAIACIAACSSSSSSDSLSSGGSSGTSGSSGVIAPPGQEGCPGEKPQADTPCKETGLLCDYGTPGFGCPDPNTQGRTQCQAGLWNAPAVDPECKYPGTGCPATAAAAPGASCPADSGVCLYPDCSGTISFSYSCVNGKLSGPTPPSCGGTDAGDAGGG